MVQRVPTLPTPPTRRAASPSRKRLKSRRLSSGRLSKYCAHISSTWASVICSFCSSLSKFAQRHQQRGIAHDAAAPVDDLR